ncbi:MAG TPA: PAS domain S-box protein, partial [Chondromyces sp.]|nr:PAS domain S-box protein [Chondromyces sp.]
RIEEVVSRDLANVLIEKYNKVLSTQESTDFEARVDTGDGEFIGEASLNPVSIEGDKGKYVLCIVRDVTDRWHKERELKEMKEKLERNQKRLNSLVENKSDAIFELDLHGRFVMVNEKVTNIIGYKKNELIGSSFLPLIVSGQAEETYSRFQMALSGKKERYETWVQRRDGQKVLLDVKNIPIVIDGETVGVFGIATDITETRQAKKSLIEAKEELEVFWNYSVDSVFFMNIEGEIKKVNPAFERTFGYKEEEILNGTYLIVPPNLAHDANRIIEKIRNGEVVVSHETKRLTKDGKALDILASYTPVRDQTGKVIGATVFNKDMTSYKKAERELQKSKEKFQLITENAFDVIKLINPSGIVEYVSPSNERVLGYTYSEYIGQPFTKYIHPDDKLRLMKGFQRFIDNSHTSTLDVRVFHKKGHVVWLEVTIAPIIEDGEVKQLVSIARDVTERKGYQDKLAKMAYYDYLSGLPNRLTFDDRLEEAIHQADQSGGKWPL